MTEEFITGLVGAPFGVEGFVKVKLFSGETAHLKKLKRVRLRLNGSSGASADDVRLEETHQVEELRFPDAEGRYFYLKLSGINSPEAAKKLTGAEIIVPRAAAAPLKKGEYYIEDLKGLKVTASSPSGSGEVLGVIADVLDGGNGSLVEVKLLSGEARLIPFKNEFFGEIDLENGSAELLDRQVLE